MNASTYKTIHALVLSTGLLAGSAAWAGCPQKPDLASGDPPSVAGETTSAAAAGVSNDVYAYLHDAQAHVPDMSGQDYGADSSRHPGQAHRD